MPRSWDVAFLDLQRQVDDMFEELIYRPWSISGRPAWRPPLDLHETPEAYLVEIDIPGVPPDEVRILVNEQTLSIAGQRRATPPEGLLFQQCERHCGEFQRVLNFPKPLDPQRAHAEYRHGTCRIYLPKKNHPTEPAQSAAAHVPGTPFVLRVTMS